MFFDNIFGTSDNSNHFNNNRSSNDDENDNYTYTLKNISLRQGRAFLKDEQNLNRVNTYLAQNTGNSKIVGMNIEGFDNGDSESQPQAAAASSSASSAPETVSQKDSYTYSLSSAGAGGMWIGEVRDEYTCANEPTRNSTGNNGDYNRYCIFDKEEDAKNFCNSDPTCKGYVANSANNMFSVTRKPVKNAEANGSYFMRNTVFVPVTTATGTGTGTGTPLDKLDDAFNSKMAAYSSALMEYNKELLKNQNYFVVQVKTLTPINSCFNCDASLSGADCAAMGVSNSNGDLQTSLPDSTSPTANLLPCVVSGVHVPGWSADPNKNGNCVAPLGQKCCNSYMLNGQPVCEADFGTDNFGESAMTDWISACLTPPTPEEINQKITIANEYCQGNGISLNYWNQNSPNFVLVTTLDPANSIRPFAKMNSIPVWIIDTFPNMQVANQAKNALVFSPTVEKALGSAREDMLNAGTALIKAVSSQQSTTMSARKAMEQKINSIKTKISKIDAHKQSLDKSADSHSRHGKILFDSQKPRLMETLEKAAKSPTGKMIEGKIMDRIEGNPPASTTMESFMSSSSSALPSSLQGQEEDTRIQLKSSYSYYTVWFVIAVLLIVVIFSNIFMDKKEGGEGGEGGEDSSSSMTLSIGVLMLIIFIYFVVQYILSYFNISRPDLPFDNINPLM